MVKVLDFKGMFQPKANVDNFNVFKEEYERFKGIIPMDSITAAWNKFNRSRTWLFVRQSTFHIDEMGDKVRTYPNAPGFTRDAYYKFFKEYNVAATKYRQPAI